MVQLSPFTNVSVGMLLDFRRFDTNNTVMTGPLQLPEYYTYIPPVSGRATKKIGIPLVDVYLVVDK